MSGGEEYYWVFGMDTIYAMLREKDVDGSTTARVAACLARAVRFLLPRFSIILCMTRAWQHQLRRFVAR